MLHAIQPFSNEDVLSKTVRGQYGEGIVDGERVPAYRAEEGVPPDSRTETFVAMRLLIDNWRWAGVPFYLRTGKRLPGRNTHIVIQFRRAPFMLFRDTPVENMMPNQLVLHIQPEEGISLRFAAKIPGPAMQLAKSTWISNTPTISAVHAIHRLRAPAARLHDRRCHAVPARRHGRGGLDASSIPCSTSGRRFRRAISPTILPAPGDRKNPKS